MALRSALSLVSAALEDSADAQGKMLRDALPHAVAPIAKGEAQHSYQLQVVECVRKALEESRQAAAAGQQEASAVIEAAEAACVEAEAALSQAAANVEAQKVELEAKCVRRDELQAAVEEEQVKERDTKAATQEILSQKAELDARSSYTKSVVGALESRDADAVVAFLEKEKAEKPLVAAVPSAFAAFADGAEGSAFDKLVEAEVANIVKAADAKALAEVEAQAVEAQHASAEMTGAWAILDVAQDNLNEAEMDVAKAHTALKELQNAVKSAKQVTTAHEKELSERLAAVTVAEQKVKSIEEAQGALERLLAPPAPAAPPVEVEAEDVPMEEA